MIKLLITLLLVIAVRAEEIGVPYVEKKQGLIQSAVLAPDGNSFYTLKDDLVTKWQLSPIKKLLSFETSIVYQSHSDEYQINVSKDNKRVIHYSLKEIQLWDIENKKHLKTVKENLSLGASSQYGFLALTKSNMLHIWDDKDLTLLKTIKIEHDYEWEGARYSYNMINGNNMLFINYVVDGLFFNLDTLKIVDTISNITDEDNKIRNAYGHTISKYRQKYMNKYANKFNPYLWRTYMKFIWEERYFSTISSYALLTSNDTKFKNEIALYKLSNNSQYFFAKVFFNQEGKHKRKLYRFYQFKDAWVLMDIRKQYFTGAGNIKKYVKMKTKDGKIIPINNATFKKYNKNIDLKDQ